MERNRPIGKLCAILSLLVALSGCTTSYIQQLATRITPNNTAVPPTATLPVATATPTVAVPTAAPPTATSALTPPRILIPSPTPGGEPSIMIPTPTPESEQPIVIPPRDAVAERLRVPEGFAIRLYAESLTKPRLMTVGPDGALYVADQSAGAVYQLADANNDGLADANRVVVDNFAGAHGVAWFNGWLYVAGYGKIQRYQDRDGDGTLETVELVTDNIPGSGGHSTRTIHFGPDDKLYVAAGSTSNIDPESDPRRATIMRFNPDGTIPADNPYASDPDLRRRPVWAEGLRNSVDFLFLPDGRLWADHNGSDMLGDELPPEEVVIEIVPGRHYGWPYCYTPTIGAVSPETVEVRDERVTLDPTVLASCDDATPALFTDLAHAAPLGMVQYNATAFPLEYQGNLFLAYHGSWNSTKPRDCRIQMILVRDGMPAASGAFITGFRENESQSCNQAWGRPAGVAVGARGELFVSDDQNGNIYRVVYTGE